jgi:hypothetical protein
MRACTTSPPDTGVSLCVSLSLSLYLCLSLCLSLVLVHTYLGQVLFLLRFVAIAHNLVDTQIAMRTIAQTNTGRCSRNLFLHHNHQCPITIHSTTTRPRGQGVQCNDAYHRNTMFEIAKTQTSVLLGSRDTKNTERAKLLPQIIGKLQHEQQQAPHQELLRCRGTTIGWLVATHQIVSIDIGCARSNFIGCKSRDLIAELAIATLALSVLPMMVGGWWWWVGFGEIPRVVSRSSRQSDQQKPRTKQIAWQCMQSLVAARRGVSEAKCV